MSTAALGQEVCSPFVPMSDSVPHRTVTTMIEPTKRSFRASQPSPLNDVVPHSHPRSLFGLHRKPGGLSSQLSPNSWTSSHTGVMESILRSPLTWTPAPASSPSPPVFLSPQSKPRHRSVDARGPSSLVKHGKSRSISPQGKRGVRFAEEPVYIPAPDVVTKSRDSQLRDALRDKRAAVRKVWKQVASAQRKLQRFQSRSWLLSLAAYIPEPAGPMLAEKLSHSSVDCSEPAQPLVVETIKLHEKLLKISAKRILSEAVTVTDALVPQLTSRVAVLSALLPVMASCAAEAQSAINRLRLESVDLFDGFVASSVTKDELDSRAKAMKVQANELREKIMGTSGPNVLAMCDDSVAAHAWNRLFVMMKTVETCSNVSAASASETDVELSVAHQSAELDRKQRELSEILSDCDKLSQAVESMRLGVGTQLEVEDLKHSELLADLTSLEDKVVMLHAIAHADDDALEKIDKETHDMLVKLRLAMADRLASSRKQSADKLRKAVEDGLTALSQLEERVVHSGSVDVTAHSKLYQDRSSFLQSQATALEARIAQVQNEINVTQATLVRRLGDEVEPEALQSKRKQVVDAWEANHVSLDDRVLFLDKALSARPYSVVVHNLFRRQLTVLTESAAKASAVLHMTRLHSQLDRLAANAKRVPAKAKWKGLLARTKPLRSFGLRGVVSQALGVKKAAAEPSVLSPEDDLEAVMLASTDLPPGSLLSPSQSAALKHKITEIEAKLLELRG